MKHALILSVLLFASTAWAETPEPLDIGATAPAFQLPGIDGKTYTLDSFADAEVLVLVFTCNHCPTAQAYEDRIQQLADDYKDRGVTLVAITPNDPLALRLDELGYTDLGDSFEDTVQRAKDKNFTFTYLYDGETQEMSRAYGPVSTPHVFVFDADRKLRFRGRIDNSEHADRVKTQDTRIAIDALLAGEAVPVETTKTSGCSVKWSDKRPSVQESLERWAQEEVPLEEIDVDGVEDLVKNDSQNLRLINVWATWCGPCRIEFPELVTMHRMYRGRDFELITISSDMPSRKPKVHEFLKEQEASTRNYLFAGEDSYALIEAVDPDWEGALPYTLLVAPGGEVLFRHMGAIDPLEVKRAIVDYLGRTY